MISRMSAELLRLEVTYCIDSSTILLLVITIDRNDMIGSTMHVFSNEKLEQLKQYIYICFLDEIGNDSGYSSTICISK